VGRCGSQAERCRRGVSSMRLECRFRALTPSWCEVPIADPRTEIRAAPNPRIRQAAILTSSGSGAIRIQTCSFRATALAFTRSFSTHAKIIVDIGMKGPRGPTQDRPERVPRKLCRRSIDSNESLPGHDSSWHETGRQIKEKANPARSAGPGGPPSSG
jgi:hypothetical protein